MDEIFLRCGSLDVMLTNRSKSFNTELMREIYTEFCTKNVTSTPYHDQTNELTERFNRTLTTMLSMYVSQHQRDWDEYLNYAVFAYNTLVQDSTGYSTCYLLHGYQARTPADIVNVQEDEDFQRLSV